MNPIFVLLNQKISKFLFGGGISYAIKLVFAIILTELLHLPYLLSYSITMIGILLFATAAVVSVIGCIRTWMLGNYPISVGFVLCAIYFGGSAVLFYLDERKL